MSEMNAPVFASDPGRLTLLTDHGRAFLGLQNSNLPVLCVRVKALFEHLNNLIGFPNTSEGNQFRECFNVMLRAIYPEVMLDIADVVYVQHERLSVSLNYDVINQILFKEYGGGQEVSNKEGPSLGQISPLPPKSVASIHDRRSVNAPSAGKREESKKFRQLNNTMEYLFQELVRTLKTSPRFYNDPKIIQLLSECYSFYLFQTENFPWQNPIEPNPRSMDQPVMDIASGLAGLRIVFKWPENYPTLYLTDGMPFIIQCLTHYKTMLGKKNVEILDAEFPARAPRGLKFGLIMSNKFLHHLKRPERKEFLRWALDSLEPNGILDILDTDIELQILRQSKDQTFEKKVTFGYLETLIDIEDDFCKTLESDISQAGFEVTKSEFDEYSDQTDAYSRFPGDNLSIKFHGIEIIGKKIANPST